MGNEKLEIIAHRHRENLKKMQRGVAGGAFPLRTKSGNGPPAWTKCKD
jgi:hypothetical protein